MDSPSKGRRTSRADFSRNSAEKTYPFVTTFVWSLVSEVVVVVAPVASKEVGYLEAGASSSASAISSSKPSSEYVGYLLLARVAERKK